MNTNESQEIQSEEVQAEALQDMLEQALPEPTVKEIVKKRLTAVGVTRPNKEQSKKNRKISAASRKKNWGK